MVLAFCLLEACHPLERSDDCRRVAELINPVLKLIDTERRQKPADASSYRIIATQYEWVAASASKLTIPDKRFSEAVADYVRVLREAERDAKTFADAVDSKNAGRIANAHAAAGRTLKHESGALGRIESYCRVK